MLNSRIQMFFVYVALILKAEFQAYTNKSCMHLKGWTQKDTQLLMTLKDGHAVSEHFFSSALLLTMKKIECNKKRHLFVRLNSKVNIPWKDITQFYKSVTQWYTIFDIDKTQCQAILFYFSSDTKVSQHFIKVPHTFITMSHNLLLECHNFIGVSHNWIGVPHKLKRVSQICNVTIMWH